ncbi:MAG: carbohydrate kinase [Planctomycetaceae bacterium]|jgi:fructokinase|nr:carbohydrate kinase [Planctomycetaceae bacterium]
MNNRRLRCAVIHHVAASTAKNEMTDSLLPFKILSFGEILWDVFPNGKKPGGAPANFAYHCKQLGANVRLLSQVGQDELGQELLDFCNNIGLSTALIGVSATKPTGTVLVQLRNDGQPNYTITQDVAWDFLETTPELLQWVSETDVIAFGSLATRSEQNRRTLQDILHAAPSSVVRVLDLNLREPFCEQENIEFVLSCADILKLNDDELNRITEMFHFPQDSIEKQLQKLREFYQFRLVILTCGANGNWLTTNSEQIFTHGIKVDVADTVGAGDAFTAASVLGFLSQKQLPVIGCQANELAAYVCTQHGGTPTYSPQILGALGTNGANK